VDQKLRGVAARRAALDAEEAHLLRYAEEIKLWRAYGFGSMLEYLERAMGYAPHTAAERLRVARVICELPLIAEALENGELAHSAVRELSRVAVPETEAEWLEAALGKSLREIEVMVSGHKPGHRPTDETEPRLHRRRITIEVSPETYDLWRRMHALTAEEHGQRLSDDELIQSMFRRAYGDGKTERGGEISSPAYKIAIKQCPDCKRAWQCSGGRDIEVDPVMAECAACDAVHLGSLDAATPERITTTVTTRKREQVLARDGYCCTVPGCRRNIGLDLHHIQLQSHGGGHELGNLTTTCNLHHRAIHYGKLVVHGTAPDHLIFEFRGPRNRRNVTDDDAPASEAVSGSGSEFALGAASRIASEVVLGAVSGTVSGAASRIASEAVSGAGSGIASGVASGIASEAVSGAGSGIASGTVSRAASGVALGPVLTVESGTSAVPSPTPTLPRRRQTIPPISPTWVPELGPRVIPAPGAQE